ncbi:MAG TPA: glutaredoxin family protein [Nitrospiria bacterium]|nr:glutaredoxin family protein [Nitrospiria bacterium]
MMVFMYTLSTCPWCFKTKQFFKSNHIPFDYVDYDLQNEAEQDRIMKEISALNAHAMGFPIVKIGDQVVVGFNPERYSELLGLKKGVMA